MAIYQRDATPGAAKPMMKAVTGRPSRERSLSTRPRTEEVAVAAGGYTVHLLMDDLPKSLASADFDVR